MAGIEQEVAALRREVTAAQQEQARAAHALGQAEAKRDAAAAGMAEEFGVEPGEAADALLAELEAKAVAEAARVRAELAKAGGPA